jgi:hypothetical protein
MVVTLGRQHHVMRFVCGLSQALYLYVILDRRRGANLSVLRMRLDGIVTRMAG